MFIHTLCDGKSIQSMLVLFPFSINTTKGKCLSLLFLSYMFSFGSLYLLQHYHKTTTFTIVRPKTSHISLTNLLSWNMCSWELLTNIKELWPHQTLAFVHIRSSSSTMKTDSIENIQMKIFSQRRDDVLWCWWVFCQTMRHEFEMSFTLKKKILTPKVESSTCNQVNATWRKFDRCLKIVHILLPIMLNMPRWYLRGNWNLNYAFEIILMNFRDLIWLA